MATYVRLLVLVLIFSALPFMTDARSYTYPYPMTYTSQPFYGYAYPQYQVWYVQPSYYPTNYGYYGATTYGYESRPSRASYSRSSSGEYCYQGYGCYPNYVEDPHQWIRDPWTGTWY